MKITPIIHYRQQSLQNQQNPQTLNFAEPKTEQRSLGHIPHSGFYSNALINFGENVEVFQKQLLCLDDIHCPACGEKMLSSQSLKELVRKAENIHNLPEYAKFLTKNQDYFHSKFKRYIYYINRIAQNEPGKSISEVHKIQRSGTSKLMSHELKVQSDYLAELLEKETFSSGDKEKIINCRQYLNSVAGIQKAAVLKEELLNTLGSLENDKKWEIYTNVKQNIQNIYTYHIALQYNPDKSDGLSEQGYIVKNMLSYSQNKLTKVYTNIDTDKRFNNMLICQDCFPKYSAFRYIANSPEGAGRVKQYANDISYAIAGNKLSGNNSYLYEFIGAVNSVTQGKIKLSRNNIISEVQDKVFKEMKSNYIFEDYEGIPCACCGVETLTHKQKLNLFKEINKCENLHELNNLSNLYSKHLTAKGLIIQERFNKLLQTNPDITEEDIMKALQYLSKQDIKHEMQNIKSEINNFSKQHKFNIWDKELLNDFIENLDNKYSTMKLNETFRYDEYDDLVSKTLNRMSSPNKKILIKFAKRNIKELYLRDALVNPPPIVVAKTGTKAKAMMQNIFKLSVITVDHINPKSNDGADEYANKVGYCKDCNNAKGGILFPAWFALHPEIKQNLPKHLTKIAEIIKREHIKGMENYPESAARTSRRLARGKLNIPVKYDTID